MKINDLLVQQFMQVMVSPPRTGYFTTSLNLVYVLNRMDKYTNERDSKLKGKVKENDEREARLIELNERTTDTLGIELAKVEAKIESVPKHEWGRESDFRDANDNIKTGYTVLKLYVEARKCWFEVLRMFVDIVKDYNFDVKLFATSYKSPDENFGEKSDTGW